ncbi:MAG: FHA domain-containing protein, partial [Deltaproteobacteria bacterium]|nr:FHA domain-containing protein [Deltaproteobacteria bacterium]
QPAAHSQTTSPQPTPADDVVATLAAIEGDLQGDAFVLHAGDNHLGRGADCSPVMNSRWISRSHATLTIADGRMTIRATEGKDLWVNDVKISEQSLQDGDLLKLGTTVLSLRTVAPADRAAAQAPQSSAPVSDPASISAPAPAPAPAPAAPRVAVPPPSSPPAKSAKAKAKSAPPPAVRKKSRWKFWAKPVPTLVFIRGSRTGERIELTSPRVRIGGLQDNDIVISGGDASRNHAELRVRDGRVHIWDLRSINGTWVNDQRTDNAELRVGDVIRIGSEELRYEE